MWESSVSIFAVITGKQTLAAQFSRWATEVT
jgi:hypothetical protein